MLDAGGQEGWGGGPGQRRPRACSHKLTLKYLDIMLQTMDFSGHVTLCTHLQSLSMCKLSYLAFCVHKALAKMDNLVTKVNQFISSSCESTWAFKACTRSEDARSVAPKYMHMPNTAAKAAAIINAPVIHVKLPNALFSA